MSKRSDALLIAIKPIVKLVCAANRPNPADQLTAPDQHKIDQPLRSTAEGEKQTAYQRPEPDSNRQCGQLFRTADIDTISETRQQLV